MLVGRKDCRNGQCHVRSLAEAVHCLLLHATKDGEPVRVEELSAVLASVGIHVSAKRLYQFADATPGKRDSAVDVPVRIIDAVEEYTGSRVVSRYRARKLGGVYVDLPQLSDEHRDIRQAFLVAVKEFGESAAAIEHALRDNRIEPRERDDVLQELDEHLEACVRVRTLVVQKTAPPRPVAVGQ